LTDLGISLGLIGIDRTKIYLEKKNNISYLTNFLSSNSLTPNEAKKFNIKIAMDGIKRSCINIMGQRKVNMAKIRQIFPNMKRFSACLDKQVEIDAHYEGYLRRQERDIRSFKKDEGLNIPIDFDYNALSGLSNEMKSKFNLIRPKNIGQASRIDGVTPAAILILLSHLKKSKIKLPA